jgi:two-component system, chemotaxis family, sensor kinase CheA
MSAVIEAQRLPAANDVSATTGVLTHRGETLPFLRLRNRLAIVAPSTGPENIVIVRHVRGRVALVVDDLHGECQVVVKPLPDALLGISGISGSSILPDGSIAFILDITALLRAEARPSRAQPSNTASRNQESSCSAN